MDRDVENLDQLKEKQKNQNVAKLREDIASMENHVKGLHEVMEPLSK